ncbi:MFS transporter [Rossellomorea marisflavi]|uniref:MFS transporter n=1 Tax=Rossellomorea marisflavi TaxID=189381 RepID=UPI0027A65328|nr:MFS transporter [Rossellomorea marisflavi]UTE73812.1 MFS transporter [Rossellomorea marisflavi]
MVKLKGIHPNVKFRLVMQFFGGLVSMAVMPFLAIYFAGKLGATITGIVLVVVILSGIAGGFLGGSLSDKLGRKKIMVYGELGLLVSYVFITLCNSPWFDLPYVTAFLFIFNMFFGGLFSPAAQAMIIDVTDSASRKTVFTISYWLANLANAIGGVVGAFLFKDYLFQLFIGVTSITFMSLLVTILFISESYSPQDSHEDVPPVSIRYSSVLKDKLFMYFIVGGILILTLEQSLTNYIGIRFERDIPQQTGSVFGLSFELDGTRLLGFLRTENTLLVVALSALVLLVFRKWKDRTTLLTGLIVFTICFSAFAVTNNILFLFILMFFGTVGELMYVPIKQAMIGDLAPENGRSTYMAFYSLTGYGAMIIASLLIVVGEWLSPVYMGGLLLLIGLGGSLCYGILTARMSGAASKEVILKTEEM